MNKTDTLTAALAARHDEILNYQINIDNFERAIAKIDAEYSDNASLQEFRAQLSDLLESNKKEQLKAIIIRDVISEQLAELEVTP